MYCDDDESAFKYKKKCEAMIDKTYEKLNNTSEMTNVFININTELKKNIESIQEILFKLSDDSRLRQVEINTISEIKNEILKIYVEMFELYDEDIDTIHLINSKIKQVMIQLKQDLKKIFSLKDLLG